MKQLSLPYGAGMLHCTVPDRAAVLTSRLSALTAPADGGALVRRAMEAPIASPPLSVLARGKKNAVILISDHTRPVPSRDILPHMLRELRQGSPDIDITLLVATGCHRGTTPAELEEKLGPAIFRQEKIRRSRNLLQYSDYSIQEISFYLGFSSQSHFCKVFQEITGETPGHYKRQFANRKKWRIQ